MPQITSFIPILVFALSASTRAEDFEFFEKHVRPILVDECYRCHSAAAEKLKGGLLLDTKSGVDKGGDNGPVLVRGNPDKSKLIEAVGWTNPDMQMPPKKKLTDQQIADLTEWVKMGAPDPRTGSASPKPQPIDFEKARQWWAFQPIKDPAPPAVKRSDWPHNPIDQFILAKLEERDLPPAAPAQKLALIRRATLDLTGLPPSEPEVAAFLADESPNAFAKVIDRLLASPHYGEKWGRHWLDIVRYTDAFDSRGIGGAADVPDAWRYRDWVVNAFNADLPYDQFITQQIAGDLLPAKKPGEFNADGIIATGMYAIGNWPGGDADKEKMLTDIVDDQVDVTGRAFLGMTVACARCHDHKFDPIPTADYYGLAGIFFSSHILPGPGKKTDGSPTLRIPLASKEQIAARSSYEQQVAQLNQKMVQVADGYRARAAAEALKQIDTYLPAAWELRGKPIVRIARYALEHKLDRKLLKDWVDFLAPNNAPASLRKVLSKPSPSKELKGKDTIEAYVGNDSRPTPNYVINKGNQPVPISTATLPPHAVSVHPGPDSDIAIGWRSPITGRVKVRGGVKDADAGGGDGIVWRVELCAAKRPTRLLASGAIDNGGAQPIDIAGATDRYIDVTPGDVIQLVIDPKAEYSFDTTICELNIEQIGGDKPLSWNLAADMLAGRREHWQFYEIAGNRGAGAPQGSCLAEWIDKASDPTASAEDVAKSLQHVKDVLLKLQADSGAVAKADDQKDAATPAGAAAAPPKIPDTPDGKLYAALTSPRGPFLGMPKPDNSDLPPEAREQVARVKAELSNVERHAPPTIQNAEGLQDGGTPDSPYAKIADYRIHIRGRYDRLGDLVPRHFPRVLTREPQESLSQQTSSSGRVELAAWVASKDNPLTARVMANRIWQWHFGQGIVRTPSNFGKLGTPPTHPELLDYLASRFIESGWSIKAMHRMIMLSATYQQSAIPAPATLKADPDDLLFGRFARRRLEAEELRDAMLACTDSLDPTLHGPPINDLNTKRRTLYLMTVRSDRSGYRTLFDAADPTAITDQRLDSTIAPQALFLMNHPFVATRADMLAKTINAFDKLDDRARIEWLYHRLFARAPEPKELEVGLEAIKDADGWIAYCQVLLCTNEFAYVD